MSDTVKLIIEIDKNIYKARQHWVANPKRMVDEVDIAIANGIPLDSNDSDRAEAQAYFDGEAYGWEQGRKALIDDVKAEIEKDTREYVCDEFVDGLNHALEIIDKHISGEGNKDE